MTKLGKVPRHRARKVDMIKCEELGGAVGGLEEPVKSSKPNIRSQRTKQNQRGNNYKDNEDMSKSVEHQQGAKSAAARPNRQHQQDNIILQSQTDKKHKEVLQNKASKGPARKSKGVQGKPESDVTPKPSRREEYAFLHDFTEKKPVNAVNVETHRGKYCNAQATLQGVKGDPTIKHPLCSAETHCSRLYIISLWVTHCRDVQIQ